MRKRVKMYQIGQALQYWQGTCALSASKSSSACLGWFGTGNANTTIGTRTRSKVDLFIALLQYIC